MKNKLKNLLNKKLTEKELKSVPASFDVVGDLLVFSDFPEELAKKEKIIGRAILKNYPHIKAILKKTKKHSGKFRLPKLKVIAGEKRKETLHKENNVLAKLNAEKAYFSPRMSSERKRIACLIKPNETILVMFSGIGIYPLVISKNTKAKRIIGIEINPIAHKYATENIKINKTANVELILGDARKIMPKLKTQFDRIIMPLPKDAGNFLDLALSKAKKNSTLHFYCFSEENNYQDLKELINKECEKAKKQCEIIGIVKCGQFSPRVYRVCVDFMVS
ncbi:class I SAM-dependent methyltransferase family protein [Candidatus Woesearchaeota archaeon]|nr:class I SAM-dependent methyltransferase family protein [Candidatus Woesearchaeota archaeon]